MERREVAWKVYEWSFNFKGPKIWREQVQFSSTWLCFTSVEMGFCAQLGDNSVKKQTEVTYFQSHVSTHGNRCSRLTKYWFKVELHVSLYLYKWSLSKE